ncbi:hypothetical protein V6N13_104841 [Hibiscus sabdariffa]
MTRNRHIHVYLEEEVIAIVTATEEGTEEAENPDDSGSEEDPNYVASDDNSDLKILVVGLKIVGMMIVNEKGGELHSASDSDSDDPKKKKRMRVPEFKTDVDMANPQFKKGMIFTGKKILKEAVREYGSTIILMLGNRVFMRLYICLAACKQGYKSGCRPIISIDGCHLKGYFGGTFLAAVGVDANDSLYPIAYAVVEAENQSTWYWFLSLLATDLEIEIYTLEEVFPSATHRTCVRHLYNNFKNSANFKGKHLKDLLWKATRVTYQNEFEDAMAEMKAVSNDSFNWLNGKDPSEWSKSHFSLFCKSDMLLSNLSKCFNKRPESFVDPCYRVTTQQQIYNHFITPMRGPIQWVHETTCEPVIKPKLRRPPDRPKKKRVKEVDEPSNSTNRFTKRVATMYYSKCRKAGHNQRTYKGEVGGNIPVNAPRGTTNQSAGASVSEPSVSLPKLPPKNLLPGLSLDHDVLKCAGTPHPQIRTAMSSSISPMRVATLRNPPSILIDR